MANNRLFLCHRPTGLSACLGTRQAFGWETTTSSVEHSLDELYHRLNGLGYEGEQDDWVLCIEVGHNAPGCTDKWNYDSREAEPLRLKLKETP